MERWSFVRVMDARYTYLDLEESLGLEVSRSLVLTELFGISEGKGL